MDDAVTASAYNNGFEFKDAVKQANEYAYDANGNLTKDLNKNISNIQYDAAHNLVSIADNATGVKLWEAKSYNGQGLLSADVNGGNRQTAYAYDLMGQCTGISNSLASFSYQYNQDGLLTKRIEKFAGSGLTETFGYDAEGGLLSAALSGKTPVSVTYGNGRTIKAKSDIGYDAWGNRRNPLTSAVLSDAELVSANRITTRGYTGHEHLDEMGLINMNARLYDPKLGLFISVDPQADSYPGTYPYAYCEGDPMNRIDPDGMDWYQNANGDLYWKEGNKEIDGYTNIGAFVSIRFGEDNYLNFYQNGGHKSQSGYQCFRTDSFEQ